MGEATSTQRAVEAQLEADAAWIWWQDPLTHATLDRAASAVEALRRQSTAAVDSGVLLLASVVVDGSGAAVGPSYRPTYSSVAGTVERLADGLLAIRAIETINVLIHRDLFKLHGVPQSRFGRYAGLEWSYRALTGNPGWLVAESEVTLRPAGGASRRAAMEDLRATARTARTPVWQRTLAARMLAMSTGALLSGRPGGPGRAD